MCLSLLVFFKLKLLIFYEFLYFGTECHWIILLCSEKINLVLIQDTGCLPCCTIPKYRVIQVGYLHVSANLRVII